MLASHRLRLGSGGLEELFIGRLGNSATDKVKCTCGMERPILQGPPEDLVASCWWVRNITSQDRKWMTVEDFKKWGNQDASREKHKVIQRTSGQSKAENDAEDQT